MIDTETVIENTSEYIKHCQEHNKQPTYNGIGFALGISGNTVRHIVTGYYKADKEYTKTPHALRCISNTDFSIIKDIFINTYSDT